MIDKIRILHIEDNPADARFLDYALSKLAEGRSNLVHLETLEEGLAALASQPFDVALLDLSLPDSSGMETVMHVREHAPHVPIIVMTGIEDEEVGLEAVGLGAQDYLVKGQWDGTLLKRAIRYAMERHHLQEEVRSLALIDALTGLYNRRGFLTLAEQQRKACERNCEGMIFLFIDMDNMKRINDVIGHDAGDIALIETAETLRRTFRESDILGRLGGDEFVVMASNVQQSDILRLTQRLQKTLDSLNSDPARTFLLSLSVGAVYHDIQSPGGLTEILAVADAVMYAEKQRKKQVTSREPALIPAIVSLPLLSQAVEIS